MTGVVHGEGILGGIDGRKNTASDHAWADVSPAPHGKKIDHAFPLCRTSAPKGLRLSASVPKSRSAS